MTTILSDFDILKKATGRSSLEEIKNEVAAASPAGKTEQQAKGERGDHGESGPLVVFS